MALRARKGSGTLEKRTTGRGHCVAFLGKTLNSHNASLHPGVSMGAGEGCVSLKKSKIGFLNPKESENGFCVSLLNRSAQDFSDRGVL